MTPELKPNGALPAYAGGIDTVVFSPKDDSLSPQTIRYQAAGLTKRELFAAMALQGICANETTKPNFPLIASDAVELADALLAELAKDTP